MEDLQATHRKQLRDLQSRITQKKKQASKKTRKGVNDECDRLEAELRERQRMEVAALNGEEVDGEVLPIERLEELTLRVDGGGDGDGDERVDQTEVVQSSPAEGIVDPPTPSSAAGTGTGTGTGTAGGGGGGKKPNRAKARLARRAAEQEALAQQAAAEAQSLPDMKEQERSRMREAMRSHGLVEKEIRADGHCLYSAFADQLDQLEIPLGHAPDSEPQVGGRGGGAYHLVRARAAAYMAAHAEDFVPFLEEGLDDYVRKVRDTAEWGGQLELLALARSFGVDINVLQDFGRVERIEGGGDDGEEEKKVWLGYYKHGFGLGEHYNSLRRAG